MLQDEDSIPRRLARTVVIGWDDFEACCIIDLIDFSLPDIHPHTQNIFSGNQRQAGNFALDDLRSRDLVVTTDRLKRGMRRKDSLAKEVVESQANVEAGGWDREDKVHANRERRPDTYPSFQ